VTESERARYIRRLRFPEELECAFQQDYFNRVAPMLRVILLIVTGVQFFFILRMAASFQQNPASLVRIPTQILCAYLLVFLLFCGATFLPKAWRYWQAAGFVVFLLLIAILLPAVAALLNDRYERYIGPQFVNPDARYNIIADIKHLTFLRAFPMMGILFTTFRLQFRWTFAGMLGIVGIGIWAQITRLGVPGRQGTLEQSIQTAVITLVCLSLVALVQERLARETFLTNYLLDQERAKSENLLLNILPDPIAQRLKERPETIADSFAEVTVLFADIADFTPLSATLPPEKVVSLLNDVFSEFDALAEKHGLEKIKTIGDAYMAVAGLPEPKAGHAKAAADMALEMLTVIARFQRDTGEPLRLRIGLNSGPVVAGVIGTRKFIYDLWGDTVNVASRMESQGTVGSVQVTEDTCRLLRDRYDFGPPRAMEVKGKGRMTVYTLSGPTASAGASRPTPAATAASPGI
jgi:class 3 adenylate cyclase